MDEVRKLAKPVNGFGDLLNIATVATSGNAVMGGVIAKAFDKLGNHAAIILENNPSQEDDVSDTRSVRCTQPPNSRTVPPHIKTLLRLGYLNASSVGVHRRLHV